MNSTGSTVLHDALEKGLLEPPLGELRSLPEVSQDPGL